MAGRQQGELVRPVRWLARVPAQAWVGGGLFAASLILYISTLAPSVVALFDDSLEFQLVTYRLGIAHPTGYPLYTLLGKLFTFLPLGNIAYRVNLMSAVFGAAAVALIYPITLKVAAGPDGREAGGLFGGAVAALLLAVSPVFWQQATVAEVYTLNALFVALLLLAAVQAAREEAAEKWFLSLSLLAGLALTHHRTIVLLWPALALYLAAARPAFFFNRARVKRLFLAAGLGLLPLLLYLYLPWRGHVGSLDGTYRNTWAGFWQQVTAGGYNTFLVANPLGQTRDLAFYRDLLENQFYVLVPGFIGLLVLLAGGGQWRLALLTGTAFVTVSVFNLAYRVADIEVFFIPVFMVWAIWSGVGAAFLYQAALRLRARAWRLGAVGLLALIFLVILAQLFQANRAELGRRYTWQVHDYGLDILAQPLPAGQSALVGILGEMTLVRYFQETPGLSPEAQRRDVETVVADSEAERLAAVERLLAEGKTVYLTRELPGAPQRWSLNAVGPLIRVDPRPVTSLPALVYPVDQPITPAIELLGYVLSRPPHTGTGPAPLRVTLFWQANSSLTADLKVSARLLDGAGAPLASVDGAPVHFAYPTTAWRPGEVVSDVYDLALPADLPAGPYRLLLIWYDPGQNAAEIGRLELTPVGLE